MAAEDIFCYYTDDNDVFVIFYDNTAAMEVFYDNKVDNDIYTPARLTIFTIYVFLRQHR